MRILFPFRVSNKVFYQFGFIASFASVTFSETEQSASVILRNPKSE